MIIPVLIPYLRSTSNITLSCQGLAQWLRANGFPIRTSKGKLCLENFSFYKSLDFPGINKWINSQVYEALEDNKPESLQLLLQGLDTKIRNKALNHAAIRGRTGCFNLLLESAADPEVKTCGNTALISAARKGETECLKLLLEHGVDLKAKDIWGSTALIYAAMQNKTDCLNLLLQSTADIETKNNRGNTALFVAAKNGKTDCLKILLQHRAKVSPQIRADYPEYADLWPDSSL